MSAPIIRPLPIRFLYPGIRVGISVTNGMGDFQLATKLRQGSLGNVQETLVFLARFPRCLTSTRWTASPVMKYSSHPVISMSRSRTPWIAR